MNTSLSYKILGLTCFLFTFATLNSGAQEQSVILDAYEEYSQTPREVAYLHLNKSTYIKGEDIGFTAYILDKQKKVPSQLTTNLYVSIEDENKTIISKKLLKVKNGVTSNVFDIDSSFTSGYYTIKAYTSWMRNFDQQNYFIETIRIIDPKVETYLETAFVKNSIDAQFLPESGHLVDQVNNTVGVVLKDHKGYGVPNAVGRVYDLNNDLVSEFEVNHLGIGKFPLLAQYGNQYTIKVDYLNKEYNFELNSAVELNGITLTAVEFKNNALVTVTTNKNSLNYLKDKAYKLTVHNGDAIKTVNIDFNDATSITKSFNLAEVATGINIFTLFNENDQPVAERLFFNYKGLKTFKSKAVTAKTINDSIYLKFKISNVDPRQFNTLSISVLPAETESYKRHNNILSYNLLQPYIKGHIEDAQYYFTEISDKTKFDMDNLLITQGWSSYDWQSILINHPVLRFPFEQGISIKANLNSKRRKSSESYMFSGPNSEEPNIFKLDQDQDSFFVGNVFVTEKENVYISKVRQSGGLSSPQLYLQAFPNHIPKLDGTATVLKPKSNYKTMAALDTNGMSEAAPESVQNLDEVVVVTQRDKARERAWELKLKDHRWGFVEVVTPDDRKVAIFLENYLELFGIRQITPGGTGMVSFSTMRNPGRAAMDIFVDDQWVGTEFQSRWPLNNVDFVEINKVGLDPSAGPMVGGSGIIKIYTNTAKSIESQSTGKRGQAYSLPLRFASKKTFYVPKYQYYNDDFYKHYGTIDWKPEIKSDKNGNFSFAINKPNVPLTLFIEGIVNGESLIYEQKTITLD
jgi:hypothetical protein